MLDKKRMARMREGDMAKVMAWISAFRARRIDGEGLRRRLIGSGYAERDVRRLTELLAGAS